MLCRHLHVEPVGGVAGDMLLAALLDLGVPVERIAQVLARTQVRGLQLDVTEVTVGALRAKRVRSLAPMDGHAHRRLAEVLAVVERARLGVQAQAAAERIFVALADAEACVHGGTLGDVELHEVGAVDSILDVVGICAAWDILGAPRVTTLPLPSGHGSVMTAHGPLLCPVPAVETLAAASGLPLVPVEVEGETVTPTGIAVLHGLGAHVAARPKASAPLAIGLGAGTRRFSTRANVVRIVAYP